MKKLILSFLLLMFCSFSFAQTDFDKQIKDKSIQLKKANTAKEYGALFTDFSALTKSKSPNRWKAYYYAGLSLYKKAELQLKTEDNDQVAETNALAYKYVKGAATAQPNNSELLELVKSIEKQRKLILNEKE